MSKFIEVVEVSKRFGTEERSVILNIDHIRLVIDEGKHRAIILDAGYKEDRTYYTKCSYDDLKKFLLCYRIEFQVD